MTALGHVYEMQLWKRALNQNYNYTYAGKTYLCRQLLFVIGFISHVILPHFLVIVHL